MNNITCPHCDQIFEIDAAGYAEIAKQVRSAEFESDLHDRLEEAAERHKMEIRLAKKESSEKSAKDSVANERKITELAGPAQGPCDRDRNRPRGDTGPEGQGVRGQG